MRRQLVTLTGLLCLLLTAPTRADMVLDQAILDFEPGQPLNQDIEVRNTGTDTLYVTVKVFEIPDPKPEQPERRELTDPRQAGLLASPNRLVVPPGGRKPVRVMVRQPATAQDLIYRISIVPQVGEVQSETLAVKVVVGYDVLAIVRPPDPKPGVEAKRDGRKLEFTNHGNTNVLLNRIRQCNEEQTDCLELNSNRLYAGETWVLDLPRDGPVEVYHTLGLKHTVKVY